MLGTTQTMLRSIEGYLDNKADHVACSCHC